MVIVFWPFYNWPFWNWLELKKSKLVFTKAPWPRLGQAATHYSWFVILHPVPFWRQLVFHPWLHAVPVLLFSYCQIKGLSVLFPSHLPFSLLFFLLFSIAFCPIFAHPVFSFLLLLATSLSYVPLKPDPGSGNRWDLWCPLEALFFCSN